MQSFVTLLTTAALLLHMSLGCCAHHAHTHNVASDDLGGMNEGCRHHHGQAESVAGEHSKHGTSPDVPFGDCDESECIFIAGNAANLTDSGFVGSIAIVDAFVVDFTAGRTSNCRVPAAPSLLAPQLRAHLLHQVFLI